MPKNEEIEKAHYRQAQALAAAKLSRVMAKKMGTKKNFDFDTYLEEAQAKVDKLSDLQPPPSNVKEHVASWLDSEKERLEAHLVRLQALAEDPELASILYPKAAQRIVTMDQVRREVAIVETRLRAIAEVRKEK